MVLTLMIPPPRLQLRGPDTGMDGAKLTVELGEARKMETPTSSARASRTLRGSGKTEASTKGNPPPAADTMGMHIPRETVFCERASNISH